MTGTVQWFDRSFGFIKNDEDGRDYFVHQTGIDVKGFRTLEGGQRVEFSVDRSLIDNREIAVNVRPLQEAAHGSN